jgi:hypothetical protein
LVYPTDFSVSGQSSNIVQGSSHVYTFSMNSTNPSDYPVTMSMQQLGGFITSIEPFPQQNIYWEAPGVLRPGYNDTRTIKWVDPYNLDGKYGYIRFGVINPCTNTLGNPAYFYVTGSVASTSTTTTSTSTTTTSTTTAGPACYGFLTTDWTLTGPTPVAGATFTYTVTVNAANAASYPLTSAFQTTAGCVLANGTSMNHVFYSAGVHSFDIRWDTSPARSYFRTNLYNCFAQNIDTKEISE